MGGGGSRFSPPPVPDPCPGKTREINALSGMIGDLSNRIRTLSQQVWRLNNDYQSVSGQLTTTQQNLSASQASDLLHTQERDNYNSLYTKDETVTIPALKTERDALIARRDQLIMELAQSVSSNQVSNTYGSAAVTSGESSTQKNVALDLDNLHTKEKLYAGVRVQNASLLNKYNEIQNKFTTDDQKSFYEEQQVEFMSSMNTALSIIYVLFFVILVLLLFVTKNEKNLYFYKIPVLLSFMLFPFLAIFVIDGGIAVLKYIYAFINVNAYRNDY
jgi:hypothetical protein